MQLRLRNLREVRAFSIVVTSLAIFANLALQQVLMPAEIFSEIHIFSAIIAFAIAAPVSYFIGLRIHEIHQLTVDLDTALRFDPLTGAFTRRAFYDRVTNLHARRISLIIADIDHFKSINDRFGHLVGDTALQQVAKTLMRNCRAEDVVARFGGEEFMILMPSTELEDAKRAAERLAERLREAPLQVDERIVKITASFGVALVTDLRNLDSSIDRADAALYRAKRDGRDRVCVSE